MRTSLSIAAWAAVLTVLNAFKPLHVDDATYYFYAAHIAAHPLDPYSHVLLYFSEPLPAIRVLAPPLLPYWWSAAICLFGVKPFLWKLWLFPFTLLFVASLTTLLHRFAARMATPLRIALLFSPVFLPSWNLMIDLPALALSLTALQLFLRACDKESLALAIFAGLIAGLAMQTKYTAFVTPAVLLVYALLHRKVRLGVMTAALAGLVFAAWETALFFRYGQSHFVYHFLQLPSSIGPKESLVGSLFPLLGGAVPTLSSMALVVLPTPRWLLFLATLLAILPLLFLVCPDALSYGGQIYSLAEALFACNGAMALVNAGLVSWRLVRCESHLSATSAKSQGCPCGRWGWIEAFPHLGQSKAWFLVCWLVLELAGYVVLSPFPAVRRIMGITVPAVLLIGCLADQLSLQGWRRKGLDGLAGITAWLGLVFFAVDYLEARAEQQAAHDAVQQIRKEHPQAAIWYAGYWGFQYYAEQYGMKQIVPGPKGDGAAPALLPPSHFHAGDWLVIPDANIPQQELDLTRPEVQPQGLIVVDDPIPLSTLMNYYAGAVPLRHRCGPRILLRLFCVKEEWDAI